MRRICPRCGGEVRAPDLTHAVWRCERCGVVPPLQVAATASAEVVGAVVGRIRAGAGAPAPLWCAWPLPYGWTVSGVAWAGDERDGPRATAIALSGPDPLAAGPADVVLVAEEPGVGFGAALAGLSGPDPGPELARATAGEAGAKVRAGGHPTPLWVVDAPADRSAYVGEARAMWLYAIAWPARAGYVLAERLILSDLAESIPAELVFGAPNGRLYPHRTGE